MSQLLRKETDAKIDTEEILDGGQSFINTVFSVAEWKAPGHLISRKFCKYNITPKIMSTILIQTRKLLQIQIHTINAYPWKVKNVQRKWWTYQMKGSLFGRILRTRRPSKFAFCFATHFLHFHAVFIDLGNIWGIALACFSIWGVVNSRGANDKSYSIVSDVDCLW